MLITHCYSLFLGAHLMISSTLKINSAASEADTNAYSLTLKHSVTPNVDISATSPLNISSPDLVLPL